VDTSTPVGGGEQSSQSRWHQRRPSSSTARTCYDANVSPRAWRRPSGLPLGRHYLDDGSRSERNPQQHVTLKLRLAPARPSACLSSADGRADRWRLRGGQGPDITRRRCPQSGRALLDGRRRRMARNDDIPAVPLCRRWTLFHDVLPNAGSISASRSALRPSRSTCRWRQHQRGGVKFAGPGASTRSELRRRRWSGSGSGRVMKIVYPPTYAN